MPKKVKIASRPARLQGVKKPVVSGKTVTKEDGTTEK